MPPDVVRMRASSTVFVKASNRVNLDFAGMFADVVWWCYLKPPSGCAHGGFQLSSSGKSYECQWVLTGIVRRVIQWSKSGRNQCSHLQRDSLQSLSRVVHETRESLNSNSNVYFNGHLNEFG